MNYTKKQIEEILDTKVDWVAVHKAYCFPLHGYRTQIHIFTDGSISEMAPNTSYQIVPGDLIGTICAEGIGNLDSSEYLDGWLEYNKKNDIYIIADHMPDAGKRLTFEQAVNLAIEDGEWDEEIQYWKERIMASLSR